jgi:hypothetical protein
LRAQTTSLVHSSNVFVSAQPPAIEYSATTQLHSNAGLEDMPWSVEILLVGYARIVMGIEVTEIF